MAGSDVFCLKIALLANARSPKLIRLPAGTCADEIASTCTNSLYPIDITLGWDYCENPSLPDKVRFAR